MEAVAAEVAGLGVDGRRARRVIAALTEGPRTRETLVHGSALSRRGVEAVLRALDGDLEGDLDEAGAGARIRPGRVAAYRERFGYAQLARTEPRDPLAERLEAWSGLVEEMGRLIAAAPAPRAALDHVPATAETVVRRALWLDGTYDLAGARLLCVGDHDLTSLAACSVNPDVAVTVVDLDERVLELIDTHAARSGLHVRCLLADLRLGLPPGAAGWADLAFTDPPYTPEGARLFLARGLEGLRDREHGRAVMAYGFGERQVGLGLKVQHAVHTLHLAYEAILPGFNRYHGAQAIGSASDLYVCRPTARTWKALERVVGEEAQRIYTRGPQSLEGAMGVPAPEVTAAVRDAVSGPEGVPVRAVVGAPFPGEPQRIGLARLLSGGLPAGLTRKPPVGVAVDLSADPGAWLLRVLLAANADRLAILLPGNHPDLRSAATWRRLAALVRPKYDLRLRRGAPDPRYAIVVADAVDASTLDPAARLTRHLLDRAHGKAGNVWREGLIRLARDRGGQPLTKNEARARVHASARRGDVLEAALVDLPRHRLRDLLDDVATSVGNQSVSVSEEIGSNS